MSDLTKVTVNLIPKATEALEGCIQLSGDNKTDSINRAIQVYHLVLELQLTGGGVFVRSPGGELERMRLL